MRAKSRFRLPAILIDTREQTPLNFGKLPTKPFALYAGDYSIEGHERAVTVERKSKSDYYGCVGGDRERFLECLGRMAEYKWAALVIEDAASLDELFIPPPHSEVYPQSAVNSLISWAGRFNVRPFLCPNPKYAARVVEIWLAKYLKHRGGTR